MDSLLTHQFNHQTVTQKSPIRYELTYEFSNIKLSIHVTLTSPPMELFTQQNQCVLLSALSRHNHQSPGFRARGSEVEILSIKDNEEN